MVFDKDKVGDAIRDVKLACEEWEKFVGPIAKKFSPSQRVEWVRVWVNGWGLLLDEYTSAEEGLSKIHYDLYAMVEGAPKVRGGRIMTLDVEEIEADRVRLAESGVKV